MPHPLVDQLRFARSEFVRGLAEVRDPEAQRRFGSINSLSWIIGHLAWHEQRYWLYRAQGKVLIPELNELVANGAPACTPPAEEMWSAWQQVTRASDPWLDELTPDKLRAPLMEGYSSTGTFMQRVIYHYWYHLGEGMAIRQMLGHTGLPDFVGNIDSLAPYRPASGERPVEWIDKATLIAKVKETRARLDDLIRSLTDEQMLQPSACGHWSVKDVLAHITWHEKEMVDLLETRTLAGSELWVLPLEQRNQAIYEEHQGLSLETVRTQEREVYAQLLQELEGLAEEDLHDPSRITDMPSDWHLSDLLVENTFRHYLDHLVPLKAWVDEYHQQES